LRKIINSPEAGTTCEPARGRPLRAIKQRMGAVDEIDDHLGSGAQKALA
jgi:hypothetical protein